MSNEIREKRKISFKGIRITSNTIKEIAEILDESVSPYKTQGDYNILYSLETSDESFFESESPVIFDPEGLLKKRFIKRLKMSFVSVKSPIRIEIEINQISVDDDAKNVIWVSGNDSIWVNGVIKKFEEVIDNCQKQPKYSGWYSFIIILAFIYLFLFYYDNVYPKIENFSDSLGLLSLIFELGPFFLLMYLCSISISGLKKLWPSSEIQSGPYYYNSPEKKRQITWAIITLIALPLLLSALYDFLS